MNATFFCENILCALNTNEQCRALCDPLKCRHRNAYMNFCEEQCIDCPEIDKCDDCEFIEEHMEGIKDV